MQVSVFVIL